jgi:hypothetical protein
MVSIDWHRALNAFDKLPASDHHRRAGAIAAAYAGITAGLPLDELLDDFERSDLDSFWTATLRHTLEHRLPPRPASETARLDSRHAAALAALRRDDWSDPGEAAAIELLDIGGWLERPDFLTYTAILVDHDDDDREIWTLDRDDVADAARNLPAATPGQRAVALIASSLAAATVREPLGELLRSLDTTTRQPVLDAIASITPGGESACTTARTTRRCRSGALAAS